MKFKTLSIFPEFFEKSLDFSLLKKAKEKGLIQIENYNLRDWADPKSVHKQIDDRPFGGGAGMIMMVEPVYKALKELKTNNAKIESSKFAAGAKESKVENKVVKSIIFSPKGQIYNQVFAEKIAETVDELILICPHYEGFDERILEFVDYEICVGDFILTGGEIPALIVIDSVSRLLPGVLGNELSLKNESFSKLKFGERNLEHPQYTRPAVFIDDEGKAHPVPEVLLSGNHKKIEEWRRLNSR